jgi:hypothetical protein
MSLESGNWGPVQGRGDLCGGGVKIISGLASENMQRADRCVEIFAAEQESLGVRIAAALVSLNGHMKIRR